MLFEKAFTLWSNENHIKIFMEKILYRNHRECFFWPDKIHGHRSWLRLREAGLGSKYSYLSVSSLNHLQKLQEIGIYTIIVSAKVRTEDELPYFDILVSGTNSYSSCKRAAEFIVNHISCDSPKTNRFILLPHPQPSSRKSMGPGYPEHS